MTHTSGPWMVELQSQDAPSIRQAVDLGLYVAQIAGVSDDGIEELANARLIAAAPDLLEALKEALEVMWAWTGIGDWRQAAQLAIAKATGGDMPKVTYYARITITDDKLPEDAHDFVAMALQPAVEDVDVTVYERQDQMPELNKVKQTLASVLDVALARGIKLGYTSDDDYEKMARKLDAQGFKP